MDNDSINNLEVLKRNFDLETAREVFDLLDIRSNTRKDYKFRIKLFLDFISNNQFNINTFLEFKRCLSERIDIGTSTKNKYLITAKIFLKELNRRGKIPVDITQNIKGFNQSKKHKKEGINDDEIEILFNRLKELEDNPKNTRLKAIISLLTFQGLRQIEIIRLDFKDIDLVNKTAMIQGKGSDDKELVDLHPKTIEAIKEYLENNNIKDNALFISTSNNRKNERITTRTLRGIIKGFLKDLEIEKSTHSFRHYFTTKLIETYEGNLLEVAKFTRHKTIEMLQVYNDNVERKNSLPKYYKTFEAVGV